MRKQFADWVVSRPRWGRRLLIAVADGVLLAAAMMLGAYWRLGGDSVETHLYPTLSVAAGGAGVTVFWARGLYRDVLRYAGPGLWIRLTSSVILVALILVGGSLLLADEREWSRAAFVGFALMGTLFCGGLRLVIAQALAGIRPEVGPEANRTPLIIYGAGASGAGLAAALWPSPWYRPVAFVDDDPKLAGSRIRDLPVHASARLEEIVRRHPGGVVALAVPSASSIDRRRILDRLHTLGVRIMTVPGFRELVAGQADFSQLREVEPDELLGRERVEPSEHLLAKCVTGKSVLVTGAGGSIGSELCRQIVRLKPARLLMLDHSEFALFQIEQELVSLAKRVPEVARVPIRAVLGSVCSGVLVEETMREHKVQTVYHAAAYKHVGMVESNEAAGVAVNTFGTMTLAKAAIKARVETFVLISTDKAVRPTSIMGASKRLAELVVQDLASGGWTDVLGMDERKLKGPVGERRASCPTRFVAVRFGNVLGSSGSVVPRFQKQIAEGGPITVTHPEVTRYFMTISEAVNLVIQAGSLGEGGEIFLLDMGDPMKIVDLARTMITLGGRSVRDDRNPSGDIEIVFVGLQPGEKLQEELFVGVNVERTEHPRIRLAREPGMAGAQLGESLAELQVACGRCDRGEVRRKLRRIVDDEPRPGPSIEILPLAGIELTTRSG
jgi:FlaA1/EpsC-like NDP-sugar epimerase